MESKLSDMDQDEWIFESLKNYKNLYMFELEFPVDSIVTISETSLCVSGIQNYSKKCEILQLSIPPKLLPKDIEEGLCKDRDFKIISGGYAQGRIQQIVSVNGIGITDLIAVIQSESNDITLFQLGDEEHALIKQKSFLKLPEDSGIPEILGSSSNGHIYSSCSIGGFLFDWDVSQDSPLKFTLDKNTIIKKIVPMDHNTLSYSTDTGKIVVFDTREGKPGLSYDSNAGEMFTFDYCSNANIFARADSNGGFEVFDSRKALEPILGRTPLPGIENITGIIKGKFDLSIEPNPSNPNSSIDFIVPGFKEDVVRIFNYGPKNEVVLSEGFVHGGHMKPVTHSLWHPTSTNLIFSCSIDSMLHAWQYNEAISSK